MCSLGRQPSRSFPLNNGIHGSSAATNRAAAIAPTNPRRDIFTLLLLYATNLYPSSRAAGFAKYVRMILAPARVIDVSVSIIARS